MSISRRDFMKFVGISVSSLLLTRCRATPTPTCYAPLPPSATPTSADDPKAKLRKYWLSFGELEARTQENSKQGISDDVFGQELITDHKAALEELVAAGILTQPVADLVEEAYEAAVYHVWRSNAPITCYEPMMFNFAPAGAQILVEQSKALDELAAQGSIDPQTIENARKALEHDLAFYSLTEAEVSALYERLAQEWQMQTPEPPPSFEQLELEIAPDDKAAAQFIIDLLLGK